MWHCCIRGLSPPVRSHPRRLDMIEVKTGFRYLTDKCTMTSAESYNFLTSVFRHVFGRDDITLYPEMTGKDLIGWDSIMHVDLLIEIEKQLGLEMQPEQIERLLSVGDLADLVSRSPLPPGYPTGLA
jgi:acyl carrier protein